MADRYWVGGSGSWSSTSKWSATSGGASGASVPTASDNAIFDANSGTAHYIVTVTDNATCADLTFTPHASNGVTQFLVRVNFVIAGTFSTSGTQGNRRAWFYSSTVGLMRDMQIATIGTVTDVDFRDIRITGTGGTLTGTRIGDLRGTSGITFSTPKTVYRIGTGNWSDDQWASSSGGSPSTDFFPLAQDTAVFDESTSAGTHTWNIAIRNAGTVDMSARTSALTLSLSTGPIIYGDWTFGSGITISGAQTMFFTGRNTQVITSAGKTFSGTVSVETYGGTVELADAINVGSNTVTINHGTFDTKGYNVTAGGLSSSNSNVREIKLGASTVTLSSGVTFTTSTNLTFDAGTSSIVVDAGSINGGGQTFYDVSFTSTSDGTSSILQSNTFNSLSITAPASANLRQVAFSGNQTITGTLTVAGASVTRRIFLRSSVVGTPRTLTVGTLSANDCDFRDITIAGTAAGTSPTRAGDCGGNSGVNFPAPKTVYWNLAGSRNWSSTAWATSSGGTPALNNFPLAQDTAVFDDTGAAGTVTINTTHNAGTIDMSARTSAMTFSPSATFNVYGSWTFGTGVTSGGSANLTALTFLGRGTSTITSNGITFNHPITIDCGTGTVQLADALEFTSTRTLTLTSGTFDAVSYNVTAGKFGGAGSGVYALRMGSGTWTLSGTGFIFSINSSNGVLYKGTADILLSDTGTSDRIISGLAQSFNKLTIGGATGISTLTISGSHQFTELASTKTVAHTIALGTTTQTFGKWSVTGTAGNVVTLTGTGTSHILAGACTSGIDYLAMGSIRFAATSPAEFYAGANSTATGSPAAPTYLTDKPADSTRYWVGGTGNWNDTNRWSTSSGGAGGADLPRSHDDVVFDSNSNATAYTATVNAITGGNRCKALTIAGPASGNVTLAGSTALFIHDDITLPATGLTRTYTGAITLSGTGAGKTITTNGVALANNITVNGVGAEWALADALDMGIRTLTVTNGAFDTANYNLTCGFISSSNSNTRALDFGSSTISIVGTFTFGTTENARAALTFSAGTSQLNINDFVGLSGNNQTFYNVSYTNTGSGTYTINGSNTFNNLTVAGRTSVGIGALSLSADQTINGTLTLSAGTNATARTFVRSDTIGTTRTLTCAAVASLTDIDFRDITIAGAAVSGGNLTGTRLGDCKGNTGITFAAGTDKYWNLAGGGSWFATAWATSSGGAVSNDNFPLAQDTCLFEAGSPNSGNTVTINVSYNIGTIDMSARTTNTMTLGCTQTPSIYGNWTNGTGVTFSGTGTLTFAGRGSHTITSAGRTFTQQFTIDTPGGSVTLQDAFGTNISSTTALLLNSGTFDANDYIVTLSNGAFSSANTNTRTIATGSGTWTVARSGTAWNTSNATNLTITGTGTISFTSASAKTFAVGTADYSSITANQGGAGALTINSINSLANITNTYSATGATTLNFGTTTQRVAAFTATGTAGNVLTIQGSSATSPCTLIHTGAGDISIDYVTITGVRAYQI
jgi:fibronectin-binding autotransporter adhesin